MSRFIKTTYEYTKIRKNFGRQTLFQLGPAEMLDSIMPEKKDQKLYGLRNPVHREAQATMPQSEHDANTKHVEFDEQGINHIEGGWPREVHYNSEELVARHRRRVMHEDNYVHTVLSAAPVMEHYVDQNNAIDMYQTYFADMHPQEPVEQYHVRISNVFRDPFHRPVSCVVWTNEKKSNLAVAYCDRIFAPGEKVEKTTKCYIWDVHNTTKPLYELEPETSCWQLACSPVSPEILVGGLETGIVNVFDIREGERAVSSSSIYNSHRHRPITGLLYIHSRTNTEFFSGSPDGQCLWWDMRNLSLPTDRLSMSIKLAPGEEPNLSNAEGVSTLEYDRGFTTKFLCGTESGLVINCNRMGKSHSEILISYWEAHNGPVRSVHRSPCTSRMFLTCGDYTIRVWSEEVRTAPIIVTKPFAKQVTDVVWAPLRFSSYMAVSEDGYFYYWDFLRKYKEPLLTQQISQHPLTKVSPHAQDEFVAIGDDNGSVFLIQMSDNMIEAGSRDKVLMFQTYERETRREHILDMRIKEIHLKLKLEEEALNASTEGEIDEEEVEERNVEEAYFKIVNNELLKMEGINAPDDILNT